jgi:hypothetical protein
MGLRPKTVFKIFKETELFMSKALENIPTDFNALDGRTRRARMVKNTYIQIIEDLGGEDNTSQNQREIARRAAFLTGMADEAERELAEHPYDDHELVKRYLEVSKTLTTLVAKLGLERKAKKVDAVTSLEQHFSKTDS